MPYPWLLPTQILILVAMAKINADVLAGREALVRRSARVNQGLLVFSILYGAGMVVRYLISGSLHPDRRWWPPGMIPIVFHWVLAAYLFLLARRPMPSPTVGDI